MASIRSIPCQFVLFSALAASFFSASPCSASQKRGNKKATTPVQTPKADSSRDVISGMYSFLREGEFVQITVEEGKLSGFVSRFGERDSDRDAFLDQFFSNASLQGDNLSFTTKAVHGTWFEFSGVVSRGDAKTPDKEGYWIIRGTLKQYDEDERKQVSSKSRQVTFKSFSQEADEAQPK